MTEMPHAESPGDAILKYSPTAIRKVFKEAAACELSCEGEGLVRTKQWRQEGNRAVLFHRGYD